MGQGFQSIKQISYDQYIGKLSREHWQEARNWYQKSLDIWQDLRNHGTLTKPDTDKPDEVTREIAQLDHLLKQ